MQYQNQFVQTNLEHGYHFKDFISQEAKQQSPSFLYNFQTSSQVMNQGKQNKKQNIHKSQISNNNIQSPHFRKGMNKNMEGKILLAKLIFHRKTKSVLENDEQEKQESPPKKDLYHSARKLNAYNTLKNDQKLNKNTQWINNLALPSIKSSLLVGKDKILKSTTSRKRQLSMLDDIIPVSSRNLVINGFQSQFSSRNKTPNKK